MSIKIREEQPADHAAIFDLTKRAFSTAAHTSHTEQFIVDALRRSGHLALSLVAAEEERLVGHVAFSPVTVSNGEPGWYGVGPLSVAPEFQRQGIGSLLMQQGMTTLRSRGARGCVLVGDPAYYSRFGFSSCAELSLRGVPPEYLLANSFCGAMPMGEVTFSPAFAATA